MKNIYIICGKTDMRKGIDGLATLIQVYLASKKCMKRQLKM
ncbi:IS66 family insertion sequence element accessory protein TnpB [Bacillus massilinigeriensis]